MKNFEEKCGLISLIGFPNSGKSTLINNLVNSKISIISSKKQTTQKAIRGILNIDKIQIIFIDTPGILKPKSFLDKNMTRAVHHTFNESDLNLVIFDATKNISFDEEKVIKDLIIKKKSNILIINKIDLVEKKKLLKISKKINNIFDFEDTYMISALKKKGFKELIEKIKKKMPNKKWIYKKEVVTDQKEDFIFSEITREKIFKYLNKELPYSIRIHTCIEKKFKLNKVIQNIFIKKESQKGILIGRKGQKLKIIATHSRIEMEKKFKKKVFLEIFVSIDKGLKKYQ